jgi:PHD/YefM family antitoxin component YafN of YafNO toxin-antitoxin module
MASGRFVAVKDLKKPEPLLRDVAQSGETCYITDGGKAKAVIIDISRYNAMMDLIEEGEAVKDAKPAAEVSDEANVREILKKATTRIARKRDSKQP